ncbi:Shedu immune nuclease family protein [Xanthomonas campestris pv. campestris]|nr:Shedu immune nuclease family protein [Xanthomonas campestris pv. campestris]
MSSVPNAEYRVSQRTDGGPFAALLPLDEDGIPVDPGESASKVAVYFSDKEVPAGTVVGEDPWIKIMEIEPELIEIRPIQQRQGHDYYGEPLFRNITRIYLSKRISQLYSLPATIDNLDELFESMPDGFYKNWRYGLGVKWDYKIIFEVIDSIPDVTSVLLHAPAEEPRVDFLKPPFYALCTNTFNQLKKDVTRISGRHSRAARQEKLNQCHNVLLHRLAPDKFKRKRTTLPPDSLAELTNDANDVVKLSKRDQRAAVALVRNYTESLAKSEPNELLRLKRDIEAVSLKELIEKCEALLGASVTETKWQSFLSMNPFVLTMAFNYPVVKIGDTPYVGGKIHTATGGRFSDFLMNAAATKNLAIVEIKSPGMKLLGNTYRSIFPPSHELSGAVAQAISQRTEMQESFAYTGRDLLINGYRSHAIDCMVIAGTSPKEDDQRRDFERYRHSLHGVHIVTFDELVARLRSIYDLMTLKSEPSHLDSDNGIPF